MWFFWFYRREKRRLRARTASLYARGFTVTRWRTPRWDW